MADMQDSRCVYAPINEGEDTRRILAEIDAINNDLEIKTVDDVIHIPVRDESDIPPYLDEHRDTFEEKETHTTPRDILGYHPSYEQIAHIALIENQDNPIKIANALLESDNSIKSVYSVESSVKGEKRIRELRHIAGEKGTEVTHREHGASIKVDLAKVYFSPRLATERQRVTKKIKNGDRVLDMFAGAGPFTIHAAKKCASVHANDINPDAVRYIEINAELNNVSHKVKATQMDAAELDETGYDHVIMNLPHTAHRYLDTAIHAVADNGIIYLYDIQPEPNLFDETRKQIREASERKNRESEVITERIVRSYAPMEYNTCVEFRVIKPS